MVVAIILLWSEPSYVKSEAQFVDTPPNHLGRRILYVNLILLYL
jgi:hypothetical protein